MTENEPILEKVSIFKKVKDVTKIKIVHVMVGVLALALIALSFSSGMRAVSTVIGIMYPILMTVKAIRSNDNSDAKLCLSFWTIFGALSVIESITDILAHFIPYYEFAKIAFYLYLVLPETKGALKIHRKQKAETKETESSPEMFD